MDNLTDIQFDEAVARIHPHVKTGKFKPYDAQNRATMEGMINRMKRRKTELGLKDADIARMGKVGRGIVSRWFGQEISGTQKVTKSQSLPFFEILGSLEDMRQQQQDIDRLAKETSGADYVFSIKTKRETWKNGKTRNVTRSKGRFARK